MRETLLIIDGRGQPEPLLRALEGAGFFCVYARGPLKAKALLKEHPVALIVWKDNTGNADLSRDLARVWKAHPRVPVIHLYAREPSAESAELGPQVRTSLPVEAADTQLLPLVEQALASLRPPPPSELQVLGAASRQPPQGQPDSRPEGQPEGQPFRQTAHTGLSVDERASLAGATGGVSRGPMAAGWRWFRGKFSRGRARLESVGR
jgi:hypothetical protein